MNWAATRKRKMRLSLCTNRKTIPLAHSIFILPDEGVKLNKNVVVCKGSAELYIVS